jgi:DNA-binding LytR/AlgR family response regulator
LYPEKGRSAARLDIPRLRPPQGNYQAIRVSGVTHPARRTLETWRAASTLARFVRVHRRTIVAVAGVRALAAMSNGDADVTMVDGQVLRITRGRWAKLSQVLAQLP